jgi:hypothetical protein
MDCSTCRRKRFPNPSRAWRLVRRLRSYYPELVKDDRDTSQLLIGQVRYSVHTLGLDNALILEDICDASVQCIIAAIDTLCDIDLFSPWSSPSSISSSCAKHATNISG